ncbi:hypothetical protein [Streptomyces sp. NPDC007905]|uniref:hypothetical protein n=1 Tax=Streptomyces sp. NPDC007905 TaxID=3364788 RepID=UPI0036E660A0
MSWTRRTLIALAVCVLLPLGAQGCATGEAHGRADAVSPPPVGKVLDGTDETGRHLREVARKHAPEVGVEVTWDSARGWDVVLTLRRFRFSPAGARPEVVPGRGLAYLYVDGRPVTRLRAPRYRLAGRLVPHGTHHVTARLYADDGTAWAVHGNPVESTADITASGAEPEPPESAAESAPAPSGPAVGTSLTGGR